MVTSFPSWMKREESCLPTKPVPPVIRIFMKPPVWLPALLLCANQGQYFVYLEIDHEPLSLFVGLVDRTAPFAPELIDEVAILFLFDLGQVEPLSRIPGALL